MDSVVINSINNDNNNLCIDFFIRKNKTFGYQEYRKDPENIILAFLSFFTP